MQFNKIKENFQFIISMITIVIGVSGSYFQLNSKLQTLEIENTRFRIELNSLEVAINDEIKKNNLQDVNNAEIKTKLSSIEFTVQEIRNDLKAKK